MSKPLPPDSSPNPQRPDPELTPRPRRRTFTPAYKLQILQEVDRATLPGEVGEILRREGLYSSHLTDWRKQRDLGKLDPDNPTKRGPKPKLSPHEKEILRLKKQLARQEEECKRWKAAVEIQGKLCELLGLPRADLSDDGTSC